MRSLGFAWRSLVRQPARAGLAILGVAAVGALLFDMLLLSEGLVVSMRDLLERVGWDVRVTSTDDLPGRAPRIGNAQATIASIAALPGVGAAVGFRTVNAEIEQEPGATPLFSAFEGASDPATPLWTVVRGRDATGRGEVVIGERLSSTLGLGPGAELMLRASCVPGREALPPARLRVVGIATFPFEAGGEHTLGGTLETLGVACGEVIDEVDVILIRSTGDAPATAAAVARSRPELRAVTNAEMLGRLQQNGFTYFRQISSVLTTVTLTFAVLLITVLLTVSVNQRVGEIAALRALGLSRRRLVGDVLWESTLIVGIGGLLSLPLGVALARALDDILKRMPGIPAALHFFVFEPGTVVTHVLLLGATALIAALYPMRLVSRLPITATLRDQVAG